MRGCRSIALVAVAITAFLPSIAGATWNYPGAGAAYSKADALPAGATPSASVSGRNITVSWTANGGTIPAGGYTVRRYDSNGQSQTIGSACAGTVVGLACTESGVAPGTWRYAVTPVTGNWRGSESAQSVAVTVDPPSMSLTPTTVTALPAVLTGQISNFVAGQTVAFRLDNPTTGTLLAGSITPSPVQASGKASVSVTIPNGIANGVHTIYAVGSSGDTVGASVSVAVPVKSTVRTSAWDVRDASAGSAESDQSDTSAFADDGNSAKSGNFSNAFGASRYIQYNFNDSLVPGVAASSISFNFNYAGTGKGDSTCFYFEVRRASTGALIGSHGSSGSPVACTTGTAFNATTTSIPEVTSTDVANDLQIRIYISSSGKHPVDVDLATVSGSASGQAFTLYESSFTDSATGSVGAAEPWGLFGSDDAYYSSAASWATSFSTSRYLKLSFPSYVPSGATVTSVVFNHSFRSATNNVNACYYFEVYNGSTLIGTHGSSSAPVSCNSSNTAWQTDAVSLPEVKSSAAADNLVIKLYVNRSKAGKSQHDLSQLELSFTS